MRSCRAPHRDAALCYAGRDGQPFRCPRRTAPIPVKQSTSRSPALVCLGVSDARVTSVDRSELAAVAAPPAVERNASAALEPALEQLHPIIAGCQAAKALMTQLSQASSIAQKVSVILCQDGVKRFLQEPRNATIAAFVLDMGTREQYALLCLAALDQSHALTTTLEGEPADVPAALSRLATALLRVDQFYDSVGGIPGYHLKSLQLIIGGNESLKEDEAAATVAAGLTEPAGVAAEPSPGVVPRTEVSYTVPRGIDVAGEEGRELGARLALGGLMAMPHLAEIYPVGGAGDRLGLRDDMTGECLPAAMLPYCGRTMIAGLMRDLQAREYLHYKLTGKQLTTPVAIMTSDAKGNHQRISALMEACKWFGRGKQAFRLFRQPMVPVLSVEDGRWLLSDQLEVMMKPGGHGAIWKLMLDEGVFTWLNQRGCQAALVRQISNPLAGTDTTLLAMAGAGHSAGASLGFMSCERAVGAAEGMNVMQERKTWVADGRGGGRWQYEYNVTNIEYTEFERLGIVDEPAGGTGSTSVFPANTNVLYVGLRAVEGVIRRAVATHSSEQLLPGLIFNTKKKVAYKCPVTGVAQQVAAGRMESTMQNIADSLADRRDRPMSHTEADRLSTFYVSNLRRKVTSSAKKRREPGSTRVHQTPDGSFFDLQRNAWHLLQLCGMSYVPEVGSVESYLRSGPGFIFLFHPALGPLWDVIAQKIRGGALMDGAELVLEVAEARLQDVVVDGSLLVYADNVIGAMVKTMGTATGEGAEGGSGGGPAGFEDDALTIHGMQFGRDGVQVRVNSGALQVPARMIGSATRNLGGHLNGNQLAHNGERFYAGSGSLAGGAVGAAEAEDERLQYSERVGRVQLINVIVDNAGIDWSATGNIFWKHQVRRREAMRVILRGLSEFEAHNVHISGDVTFEVPDGYRMVVTAGVAGKPDVRLYPLGGDRPTWQWGCRMARDGAVQLLYQGQDPARQVVDEYVI